MLQLSQPNPDNKFGFGLIDCNAAYQSVVQLRQKFENGAIVSTSAIGLWNTQTSMFDEVAPNYNLYLGIGKYATRDYLSNQFNTSLKADYRVFNQQKFHNWQSNDGEITTISIKTRSIPHSLGLDLTSLFRETYANVRIITTLEDVPVSWGTIEFKDPWLVDFNDAPYGLRNRGMAAPFYDRASPFTPDLTTAYPVQSGSATYKGVFLNQVVSSGTYYSVRAQSSQSIGGYTGDFLGWAGVGATPSTPAALETPVVFTAPNAVVSARYKGRLLSSLADATGNSGQRRLMRVQDGTLFFVYESAGQIWITHSTDGGNTWQPDRRLGEGKNPSLADAELGRVLAVWLNPNYINPIYQTVERHIQTCLVGAGTVDPVQRVPYHSDYLSPTLEARPVAIRQQFTYGSTAVFFEFNDNDEMGQGQRTGLAFAVATDNYVSNWVWNPFTDYVSGSFVSGFNRALNPTITQHTSMGSQGSGLNHNFGLAWVAAGVDGIGAIKYAEMKFTLTQPYKPTLHSPLLTFTQGSYQSSPSISSTPLIANAQNVAHHKFLTWTGVHNYSPHSIFYLRIPEGNYVTYPATVITSPRLCVQCAVNSF